MNYKKLCPSLDLKMHCQRKVYYFAAPEKIYKNTEITIGSFFNGIKVMLKIEFWPNQIGIVELSENTIHGDKINNISRPLKL
jgi:hypothetical protein